jgi:hypothetical protein
MSSGWIDNGDESTRVVIVREKELAGGIAGKVDDIFTYKGNERGSCGTVPEGSFRYHQGEATKAAGNSWKKRKDQQARWRSPASPRDIDHVDVVRNNWRYGTRRSTTTPSDPFENNIEPKRKRNQQPTKLGQNQHSTITTIAEISNSHRPIWWGKYRETLVIRAINVDSRGAKKTKKRRKLRVAGFTGSSDQ